MAEAMSPGSAGATMLPPTGGELRPCPTGVMVTTDQRSREVMEKPVGRCEAVAAA
jgi:hypothetical protein